MKAQMIKINKPKKPPMVKYIAVGHTHYGKEKWRVCTKKICDNYDSDPKAFIENDSQFTLDYGYNEFRRKLQDCVGLKCWFCEKAIDEGEIEHFRPKAGFKNDNSSKVEKPGYYWLAYKWENMILSCGECNDQKRKGNRFPLLDEKKRFVDRKSNLKKEKPYLVNPCEEDPSLYITYNLSKPVPLDKKNRGKKTIEIWDLENRADLEPLRMDKIRNFLFASTVSKIKTTDKSIIAEANKLIKDYLNPKQPFAGMIIENRKHGRI